MKTTKKKPAKKAELERMPDGHSVIGLDVSSSAAGWAVAERINNANVVIAFGVIKPPSSWKTSERSADRIQYITEHVLETCRGYHQASHDMPEARVIMEWQSHLRAARGRNVNGLAVLGQSQGSVWRALLDDGYQVDHVSERTWTKINGWPARKEDRARLIRLAVPEYRKAVEKDDNLDQGLDIADAIGLTLYRLTI